MKLATWNVNSLKVRLPQVLDWLTANSVDILCLQELKLEHDKFPHQAFYEIGYHAQWAGQKTYNGVAILSRVPMRDVARNIHGFEDVQQRAIALTAPAVFGDLRIICVYCPNGQALISDKYKYKLRWFEALKVWLNAEIAVYPYLAVIGDYNIAPTDADVHNPEKLMGEIHVSVPERAIFRSLLDLGLTDAFRMFTQPEKSFTWWDYRQLGFRRNVGLRIDHVLLSDALRQYCIACEVDRRPRSHHQPSDHAPVIATLKI